MAEVEVSVAGRSYTIACGPGEETSLQEAAALLDAEAATIEGQLGRIPEARMLLMAGLMLADRTRGGAGAGEQQLRAELAAAEARAAEIAATALELTERAKGADSAIAIEALERATLALEDLAETVGA